MSINQEDIQNLLEILGIYNANQLKKRNINYMWQTQYKLIQTNKNIKKDEKAKLLVNLNSAKDELEKLDPSTLLKAFDTQDLDRDKYKKSKSNNKSKTKITFIENLNQNKQSKYSFDLSISSKILFISFSILILVTNIIAGLLLILLSFWVIKSYGKSYILVNNKGIVYNFLGIKKSNFHIDFSEISKCSFCPPNFITIKYKDTDKKSINLVLPEKRKLEIINKINDQLNIFKKKGL